jgi:hypothetical protein
MAKYPFKVTSDLKVLGENGAGPTPLMPCPAHYIATPSAINSTAILAATNLGTAAATATAGIASPDVPRNLSIKGNAAGIVGTATVNGKRGTAVISEAFVANGTAIVSGSKAFDAITNVVLPAYNNGTADSISVGVGNKLGLAHKLTLNTVLFAFLNNTKEGTAPTMASNATAIEIEHRHAEILLCHGQRGGYLLRGELDECHC